MNINIRYSNCKTLIALIGIGCTSWTPSIFGGRPLTVDDAEPVAFQAFELEAGLGYSGDHNVTHFDAPLGLAYGVLPRWEMGVGFGGQMEKREVAPAEEDVFTDIGDLTLGSKVKVLTAERFWADHSIALTLKLPTASYRKGMGTGRVDYDLMWIASKAIGDRWNIHVNAGHTWMGDREDEPFDNVVHYGVAADYQLTKQVQLVAEVFADTPLHHGDDTEAAVNGGVRWQIRESLTLDAAVGAGIVNAPGVITGTLGLTWSFGFGEKK